jgi:HIRAN domain
VAGHVSLSKKQLATPIGAELLGLCESIKSDGQLSKDNIISLAKWLRTHKDCELPAAAFLSEVVERIIADKKVSADEMAELHLAIEKVLPGDVRKTAVESRKVIENAVKQKKKDLERARRDAEKQAEKAQKEEERERLRQERADRPRGFHSKIAGVAQRNGDGSDRQKIIRDYVRSGMTLIHKRERNNRYDENAISLWVKTKSLGIFETERQIGYLNTDVASEVAPHLDSGGWTRITVSNITGGDGDKNYGVNIFIEDH